MTSDGHGSCPASLEVKAAGDAVDVKNLTNKEKSWQMLALKCVLVNGREGDAATSDKLVLMLVARGDRVNVVC